ncbi:hypothetical protein Fuma_02216 [Fuerstiella marisgermanici]|uniref:WD domain, G-beta repeat n=1 Tax=Fuerstiella marisgermanici TaxID=1891926 RepID=A0A1P8WEV1_9PLAN|nr:hypothetical protein Fuma_02216 [Fuerstiella marisgermanici]
MSEKPSLDELFLKASELRGTRRSAFLKAQPASVRKQLRQLLAADASVDKRGFLDKPLHGADQASAKSAKKTPPRASSNRTCASKTPTANASKPSNRATPRKKAPKRETVKQKPARQQIGTAGKLPPRRGSVSKSKSRQPQQGVFGQWLTIVFGVVGCFVFAGLIVGALKFRQSLSNEEIPVTIQDDSFAEEPPPAEFDTPDPEPTPEVSEPEPPAPATPAPPTFYTAAVNAPPLTKRQLETLPTAMSAGAPVTNPAPLPGVRSWTFDTIGYKNKAFPAISVDGRRVAISCEDGNLRIINVATGRFEKLILMPSGIGQIAWSKDSSSLLTSNGYHIFKVDVESGQVIGKLGGIRGAWSLSSDRQKLYAISHGAKKIRVYAADDFSVEEEFDFPSDHRNISLAPDDRYISTVQHGTIDVYENSRPLKKLIQIARPGWLTGQSWSESGLLATGWSDGKIAVYDANSTDTKPICETLVYPKAYRHVRCWDWLNDDIVLMTGTDQTVDHYSVSENRIVASHRNDGWGAPLTYSRNLKKGVVCGQEANLLVDGEPQDKLLQGDIRLMSSLAFNHDGSQLLTPGSYPTRFDLNSGRRAGLLDGGQTGMRNGRLHVAANNRILCVVKQQFQAFLSDPPKLSSRVRFDFSPSDLHRAVWTENGSSVLALVWRGPVVHCRLSDSTRTSLVIPNDESISDVAWDERNQVAVLVGSEHLFEWNPATNVVQEMRELPEGCRTELEINPSCTHLAIAGEKIVILTTKDYQTVLEPDWVRPHARWISDDELFGVTSGGKQLNKVNLKDPAAASAIAIPLEGYKGRYAVTFSPTAPVGAGIVGGNQIRFFDTRNGAHLGSIILFGADDYATFTPDGRIIGSSDGFRKQIVYQIKTDEGQQTLTPEEFFRRFGKHFKNL